MTFSKAVAARTLGGILRMEKAPALKHDFFIIRCMFAELRARVARVM